MATVSLQRQRPQPYYPTAVLGSVMLHVVLAVFLLINFSLSSHRPSPVPAKIIDAVVVDAALIKTPEPKVSTDAQSSAQRQAELQKQAELKKQTELKKQQAEQQRLAAQKQAALQKQQALEREQALRRQEEEKRRQEEKLRQQEIAREQARIKAEAEAEQKQLEAEKLAEQKALEAARAKEKLASELAVLRAEYERAIRQKISRYWIKPVSSQPGDRCEILIKQIPGGEVVSVIVASCRGDSVFQRSVENAVHKASPLPYVGFERVFDREIRVNFNPQN